MSITSIEQAVPIVDSDKNYWLIRTQGGKFYDEYRSSSFIAIGWNSITLEDILTSEQHELIQKLKLNYPKRTNFKRLANQMINFAVVMKAGDTVIIPSASSSEITIGVINDDEAYNEFDIQKPNEITKRIPCHFEKRRSVTWKKKYSKWDLDMKFFRLFSSQLALNSANEHSDYIDRLLYNFYIQNDKATLILRVEKEGKVPFQQLFPMGSEILKILEEYNDFTNSGFDLSDIEVKVNVQSKGRIVLTGAVVTIITIGMILVILSGGEATIKFPIVGGTFDFKVDSFLEKFSDFLDSKQDRENKGILLQKYLEDLEVVTPDELKTLLITEH